MRIHIHRGQNQIGGNIIEISTDTTKILLDVGLELNDGENQPLPSVEGLFDSAGFDAIFISHYHGDHIGLAYRTHKDIPVYMGEASCRIVKASDSYKNKPSITPKDFLRHKQPITVGDITVTPFLCDHSAFDSYMLLCEAEGESVLYTGDFRSNGRKSFDALLKSLPDSLDALLCEGTTLSRDGHVTVTERELEEQAVKLFRETTGPVFVLQSSMNIDRIVTMYRAAKRSGRIFLEETYMSDVAAAAGARIPNPAFDDVYAFISSPAKYDYLQKYEHRLGKDHIAKSRFVMCVRNSMLGYLKSLSEKMSFENGQLVYSFWSGYKETDSMKKFISECESLGLKTVTLHTSGHADETAIKRLIETVNPRKLIPIHTENAKRFKELAPDITIEEEAKLVTEIDIIAKLRKRFGNNSIRLPRDIKVEIIDDGDYRITLLADNIVGENMQKDCNAFEGWSAAIHVAMEKRGKIILDTDKFFELEGYRQNGHYCRFLYRAMKFSEQYTWFELSDYLQKEVEKFKAYLANGTFTNNIPMGAAHENKNKECFAEARLAESGVLKKQLCEQFDVGDGPVYRQLPVGLFEGEVAEKNMVFTGAKSAVDLWNISDDEFRVYELKTENKMVGIVTEAFFYSNYFYDFLVSGAFTLNRGAECDRGYPELLSAKINKIVGVLLADEFHPLINSETVKLLNGNNLNIEYVSARYCLEQTLR